MRIARFVLPACAGALIAAAPAAAQTPPRFRLDVWTTDDGLPSAFVSQMVETRDGFLWLASGGQLVRYDGFEFRSFTGATDTAFTARVATLYAGLGDTLWIVLENGAVVALAEGRATSPLTLPVDHAAGLAQDARGRLLLIHDRVWRWSAGRLDTLSPRGWRTVNSTAWRDGAGRVWVAGAAGALLRITEREAAVVGTTTALVPYPSRGLMARARRRGALTEVVDPTGVVLAAYRWSPDLSPLLVDRGGRLWAHNRREVRAYEPGRPDPLARVAVPPGFDFGAVLEDRSGNIWISGIGLIRIQAEPFRTLSREAGLPPGQIRALARGPLGTVLATQAQSPQRLYRIAGERAQPLGMESVRVDVDARGTRWQVDAGGAVRGYRDRGAPLRFPRRGTYSIVMADDPSRPGTAWFAGDRALYRAEPYAEGGPRIVDSIVLGGYPRRMAVAGDGVVWAATDDADGRQRLTRWERGAVRVFAREHGLPAVAIRAIVPDSGGAVWLGTYGAGLVRLAEGRFQAVRAHNGLAEDVVSEILDDGAGNFWMAGNRSVHRVARAEVEAFMDGRASRVYGVAYGRRDGLLEPETSGGHGARTNDGRLWFPTFGGAAVVHPAAALALDSAPPIVHVLGIRLADDLQPPRGLPRLPRGQRRLSIAYTAVDLRNPAGLRFAYRLDGVDADWIHAGTSRTAVYNDVGPGRHTFRVRAINAGGAWSEADATLAFTVPAFFHETIAFYLLVAALIAAGARFLWVARTRQLRRRQDELRALVDERTSELETALTTVGAQAEQLRSLDQAKSRFFANASHEFRTPLSLILGPIEDVRDGRAGPLPELARKRLDSVLANGRRLVQLVEQLLDVARLESGTLTLRAEVRDLVPLLRRTTEAFASLAERRGLAFRVSCPVGGLRVRYDPDQMEKVLGNLLGNALKFTPSGGRVEVRAHTEGDGPDGSCVVEIEDSGPGIPAAHQARVFDRFYQVDDSPRRAHEGAGIGLALARELVDLHGGTLALRSVEGAGSTFIVRLPLATGATHVTGETPVPRPGADARAAAFAGTAGAAPTPHPVAGPAVEDVTTVLVAEDNAELLAYLREHLAERYRVLEAGNGAQALELAREYVPDLIVSDVMMPELDGQALCEAVKRDPEIDFIPVILLTAKASRESRLAGLEGGADDYLAKPVDVRELLVRAANLITSRRRLKERWQEARRELPTLPVPRQPGAADTGAEAFLKKLYAAMAEHIGDEDFQVDALAKAVAMGRSTLYRRLETLLGRSPMDVLWDYRLEQAAQWLGETDANVSEIAYGVGFKSVPHFCSRFRERFGHSPSAYRQRQARATAEARRS